MMYGQPRGPWVDAVRAKTALPGRAGEAAGVAPQAAVVAQLVALVAWGNAFLRKGFDASSLHRDHSTLRACNKTAFADVRGLIRSREVPIAADPQTWLRWLRQEDCHSMRLRHVAALDKSGRPPAAKAEPAEEIEPGWVIECHRDATLDRWQGAWQLTNRYAPQNRRWSVVYTRVVRAAVPSPPVPRREEEVREKLVLGLAGCRQLAAATGRSDLAQGLESVQRMMEGRTAESFPFPGLLPGIGGTPWARQALHCCCVAMERLAKQGAAALQPDHASYAEFQRATTMLHEALLECVEFAANTWSQD